MIQIPVYDIEGKQIRMEQLDPELLGGRINYPLLKQAVDVYRANLRQGTVGTRSRGMVAGSTRKLYRQKGTGRARMGTVRTPLRRGGGMAFAKVTRDFSMTFPRKMRRAARNSALLAKAEGGGMKIIEGLKFESPKTAVFARMMRSVGADRGALLAVTAEDPNVWKSARNIPDAAVKLVWELNAYEVLRARALLLTPEAFASMASDPQRAGLATTGGKD